MSRETAIVDIQKHKPNVFNELPPELKEDAELARLAIKEMGNFYFKQIPAVVFERDRELALFAMENRCPTASLVPMYKNDKEFVMATLRKTYAPEAVLPHVGSELWNEPQFIDDILYFRPSLAHFPAEMRDNKDIVKKVLSDRGSEFRHISDRLKSDEELILIAAATNWRMFEDLAPTVLDKQMCVDIINTQKAFTNSIPEYVKMDKDVVKAHMNNVSGNLFARIDPSFKSDEEIVTHALVKDAKQFEHIDESLKNNVEFVSKVIKIQPAIFEFLPEALRNDKEIAMSAMKKGNNLWLVGRELRNDKQIVLEAVSSVGQSIRYASKELRQDEQVIQAALLNDPAGAQKVISSLSEEDNLVGTWKVNLNVGEHSKYNHDLRQYDLVLREDYSFKYLNCDICEDYDAGYPRASYYTLSGTWRIDDFKGVDALYLNTEPFMPLALLKECTESYTRECQELNAENLSAHFKLPATRTTFSFAACPFSQRL